MGSHVHVDVSYVALAFQLGVERDAADKALVCTQQGVAAVKHEQNKKDTYQSSVVGGHRSIPSVAKAPSGAMGSDIVALVKMLGYVTKHRRQKPYSLCIREIYEWLVYYIQH
jgi:hypothetical protein